MNVDTKLKMNAYLRTIGHTTPDERGKLRSWINETGTAYGNPWDLYGENGALMDYLSAFRIHREIEESPFDFFAETPSDCLVDEPLPF